MQHRPATIWDVIDAAERYLDENGLDRPHLAGNTMGGFVALELARRGRAGSVCAISPGGFWSDDLRPRAVNRVRRGAAMSRRARPLVRLVMKPAALRRLALRDAAALELHGGIARDRLPGATFTVLPDVAHVPMLDDPELVARTILASTGAAKS